VENLRKVDAFLIALDREISMYSEYAVTEHFETIFFGGGTPSLLSPRQMEKILNRLHSKFAIDSDVEITAEANPGTVDAQKLKDYRALGINRLSIGIQSFDEDDLLFLTRIHSSQQAKECVRTAHRVGFENVNLDLIFALPNQSIEKWQSNLRQAVDLEPQHISAYSLIVERGTPLARMVAAKQISPVPVEQDALMYEWTMEFLAAAGYEHYEVSNFARPGYRSRHNSNYWNHTNYLGFGPSAHSFWASLNTGTTRRWWNIANLSTYVERISHGIKPVAGEEMLNDDQLLEEAVMLGLRSSGIDCQHLQDRFNAEILRDAHVVIRELFNGELAVVNGVTLRLTDRGYLFCDQICERILADLGRKPKEMVSSLHVQSGSGSGVALVERIVHHGGLEK